MQNSNNRRNSKRKNCLDCNKELSKTTIWRGKLRCKSCSYKFHIGKNATNYKDGRSLKSIFCLDCNIKLKDHRTKRCKKCAHKGVLGSNYIDGRTPLANAIRKNSRNYDWKKLCFERDHYTCQECGQIGGVLNVDHIKPFSDILQEFLGRYSQFNVIKDRDILLKLTKNYNDFWNLDNGRTLCIKCHKKTNTYGNKSKDVNMKCKRKL